MYERALVAGTVGVTADGSHSLKTTEETGFITNNNMKIVN